ncbi:S-layer homology domain-containing protein [Paenibacillus kobensis]|uniref:S-layer homology domain-containing protein n=1 Tax=Paenibacillus kobensis TaxID=59841 RepID=UPI000FD9D8E3|nr:S-layer homology domain-containing protein [Paenibacillus kobensis]
MKQTPKKLISLMVAFIVTVMTLAAPASAESYRDSEKHWAQAAINQWSEYGVVQGSGGAFRPNDDVTRAEFATMINNIMKYTEKGTNPFSDMKADAWYSDAMLKLNHAGVLNGVGGKALPNNPITRQEAAVILFKAFHFGQASTAASFTDGTDIAAWAQEAVTALASAKVINGRPDGSFKPQAHLTRAEAVTVFNNFIQDLVSKPGDHKKDVQGNVVVNTAGAVLNDMNISGNLYITQGVGEGEVTLNNVEIEGSVFVEGGGEHSIIFNSVDVNGALVVNKYNGKVRVLATGTTSVSVTRLESGALLVTKELTGGGFETVEIPADVVAGQEIVLDGTFNKVVNQSSSASITANGTIKELVADADTKLKGEVKVEKVSGDNSASVNDKPVSTTSNTNTGTTGGSPSPGTPSPSIPGGLSTVSVVGVLINERVVSLSIGQTKQLTATVLPTNATNKKVTWSVIGGSGIISIDQNGLVTALKEGTAAVKVVTEDGSKTDEITVTVHKTAFTVSLSKFEGSVIDAAYPVDPAVIANSASLNIKDSFKASENMYVATITASSKLQATTAPAGQFAYVVATLKDSNGNPVTDTTDFTVTVTKAVYSYSPVFGEGISSSLKAGSFIMKLDSKDLTTIQHIEWKITRPGYEPISIYMTYAPFDVASIKSVGPITGDPVVGSTLTAGAAQYEGTPANNNLTYQWSRTGASNAFLTIIPGATSSTYVTTNDDVGKYIQVLVSADNTHVLGSVGSSAFGPITAPVDQTDLFTAIEDAYLANNVDQNNIISDLNLMTSLSQYPGATLSWSSDMPTAISNVGAVTRDSENDQFVNLTVTISGTVTATKTYELIVRRNGTDNVGTGNYIDSYFAEGYPQAYVKDGTIWVRYMLTAPAEVYMVVNTINGHWDSDVKAGLEGHSGTNNTIVYANKWPYFNIDNSKVNQVQDFDTGAELSDGAARVEFVIKDASQNYTSSNVTTVHFDQTAVEALDTYPPYNSYNSSYINKALDTIYLFYNEFLDLTSVPAAADYTLSKGVVDSVTLFNYDNAFGPSPSYVKLKVSGITANDAANLKISYTGTAVQDLSDAKNKANTFSSYPVAQSIEKIELVKLSSDRTSMNVDVIPGWNPQDHQDLDLQDPARFTVSVNGTDIHPATIRYSYSIGRVYYTLKFANALPDGAITVTFDSSNLTSWTTDAYSSSLSSQDVQQLEAPGTPTASYAAGRLSLAFADGFEKGNESIAAGLVIKVDGVEYALRGYIVTSDWNTSTDNDYLIDFNNPNNFAAHIKNAIEAGAVVEIKYTKVNGTNVAQLSDSSGTLLPDFDYITVTK